MTNTSTMANITLQALTARPQMPKWCSVYNLVKQLGLLTLILLARIQTPTHRFPTQTASHFLSHLVTQQPAVIKWSVNYRTTESTHTHPVRSHKHIYTHTLSVCERDRVFWPRAVQTGPKWIFLSLWRKKSCNLLFDQEGHTHTNPLAHEANKRWGITMWL